MSRIIKKWQSYNLTYRVIALVFSVILFLNTNKGSVQSNFYNTSESYHETVQNVPIQLIYDTDEYYVHGYETTATVSLSSINRIQLDAEVNEDTRKFNLVADLSDLKTGTYEVNLRAQNLSSAVSAEVSPKTITVTIEKKVTKTMTVESVVSASALEDGFEVAESSVSPKSVEITTGEETLAQIARVVAIVNPSQAADDDFSEKVTVEALDAGGQPLSIAADPAQVTVAVKLTAPEKQVALTTSLKNEGRTSAASYKIELSQAEVTISGAKSVLETLDEIQLEIDVADITGVTTRSVRIPADNYRVKPEVVNVTITPVYTKDSSSDSSAADTQSSSAQTNSNNNNNNNAANTGNDHNNTTPSSSQEEPEPTPSSESQEPDVPDSGAENNEGE